MTQADVSTVAVTCRTEYLGRRHVSAARFAWVCMVIGLLALVILNAADVGGTATAVIVAGALACSLALAAFGRLGRRGAVIIAADADSVYLGDEQHGIVSRPLADLRSVSLGALSETTGARTAATRELTIKGLRTLTIEFGPTESDRDDTATEPERWRIGVVESDPAAAEVIGRLRARAPQRTRRAAAAAANTPDSGGSVDVDRPAAAESRSSTPRVADAGSDEAAERLWEEATRRHDTILRDYGNYELQPDMMLRFPAVTDVTLTPVQDFHEALDDATALRTDAYPGSRQRADEYQQAVNRVRRAWIACETNGRKLGTTYLEAADRDDLDKALKLFNHAQSSSTPAEQASYYTRVHEIVTTLTDRGSLHPPQPAIAELKAATRRAIEARPAPAPQRPEG